MRKLLFAQIMPLVTAVTYDDDDGSTKTFTAESAACKALFDAQAATNSNVTSLQLFGGDDTNKLLLQLNADIPTTITYVDDAGEPANVPDGVTAAHAAIADLIAAR